ncbi:MAG TPA: M23 family metallopeptidase [Firmicutes bacterium]|nr:M23 family metallopeptidase [Bacillota bacterium]
MKMNHRRYKVVYVSTAEESFKQKYLLPVFALCSVLLGMLVGLWRAPPPGLIGEGRPGLIRGIRKDTQNLSVSMPDNIQSFEPSLETFAVNGNANGTMNGTTGNLGPSAGDCSPYSGTNSLLAKDVPGSSCSPEVLIMIPGLVSSFTSGASGASGEDSDKALIGTATPQEPQVRLVSYKVQPGDTLTQIAKSFNTTVNSITAINGLTTPDKIPLGTILAIMENGSGTICRVEKGDTLSEISKVYGVPVDKIMQVNGLSDPQSLSPGQLLLLPGAKVTATSLEIAAASRSSSFSWPLTGRVTDGYGWRIHPITGKRQFHEGIDIAAPLGTAIKAAAGGTVSFAGWSNGYGRLVVIRHSDGYETRYGHLSRYAVSKGQRISKSEILGYVGQSGDATGPHVHFEIRVSGRAKNPRNYLP